MASTPTLLTKSTVVQQAYQNFYDRLKDNVTSVTLSDTTSQTIQNYVSAFPDTIIDSSSDYPILVITSPNIEWAALTFNKKWCNGTIEIEIFTTKAESADLFIDAIINSIETYRSSLKSTGRMDFVNLESTDKDEFFRGKIKVHRKSAKFSFRFSFTGSLT